jgi:hypothetical protein
MFLVKGRCGGRERAITRHPCDAEGVQEERLRWPSDFHQKVTLDTPIGPDVDLKKEVVRDKKGRQVTDA